MKGGVFGGREVILVAVLCLMAPVAPAFQPDPGAGSTAEPRTADVASRIARAADVGAQDIENQKPGQWLSYGRTYSNHRFSPLGQINASTVKNLGVAWQMRTNTVSGLEGTPIVNDGIMYVTGSWSKVWALDAATGKELWTYDPQVPGKWGRYACCDVVNRGVAIWKGFVYLGTLDGRLVKLDGRTGKLTWEINTIDRSRADTITGAPLVVDGLVVIGNAGAEYDTRGHITAYDAESGREVWRFYVVPGDPAKPQPNEALYAALKTWKTGPGKLPWWKMGGGGAPWNSLAYDPDLQLLYVGTGNGDPWNQSIRSPGGGDNLYLSSILALQVRSGKLAWYYQVIPGDTWDYDATQDLTLADLEIGGKPRHVIMQASKDGFYYVLDRGSGELLSAKPFAGVNWAKGIDMRTGRPIVNASARYGDKMAVVMPAQAHNWQPMTFDPQTGLVYIPTADNSYRFFGESAKDFVYTPRAWNIGVDFAAMAKYGQDAGKAAHPPPPVGYTLAWDPVTQREAWRQPMATPRNGGLLSTAGHLVFGGGQDGFFSAYDATTGEKLWSIDLKTGILAPPVSYSVDGVQYVALLAGWGGPAALARAPAPNSAIGKYHTNQGRLFSFALGGVQQVAALTPEGVPQEEPPPLEATPAQVQRGFVKYSRTCAVCHGFYAESGGVTPDLRLVPGSIWGLYEKIVLDGVLQDGGMASFKDILTVQDVVDIRAYVLEQAHTAWSSAHPKK